MATAEATPVRREFSNEPFTDYSVPANRQAMEAALAQVKSELGREYPMWIAGEKVTTPEKLKSVNPSRPAEVIGSFPMATAEMVDRAVKDAAQAFESWKKVAPAERAEYLFRLADLIRQRKHYYSAWLCLEVGKTWPEADADTAETIDFCEYYGREMLRLTAPVPLTPMKGENNQMTYIPLGVGAVIPPWNFPFAIMAGLTVAALVTGNTVVLKPAEDSPTIAYKFMELVHEAGIPKGAVQFLSGLGEVVGAAMVRHPQTRFVSFTGSKDVGLIISAEAGKRQAGQKWIKRIVLEMGGKDAIIVDEEADLEAAVEGVAQSAFGYQGQKCSACSRAIVSEKLYDVFVEKLAARAEKVKVGPADDPGNAMGPVINADSVNKIESFLEVGKKEGRVVAGGSRAPGDGYFFHPTVIADIQPGSKLDQEEIFGPVVAVIKAKDFEQALSIANGTEFGLTGGVYSRNPQKLARAREDFHVGNLYLNRKCTGAMVGAHPFGGFNMSGTDSKAGGRDYLMLFLQAKTVAEKVS
jgi:1-pyrroline-5-carboxylate dehydrogenase